MAKLVAIENEPALRHDLSRPLELMGHDVTAAKDGHRGLDVIYRVAPDLVISDVRVPYEQDLVNGIAEVEAAHPEMSTILLGSPDRKSDLVEGMRIGADDFMIQPVDYDLLEAKIASNLRKRADMQNAQSEERLVEPVRRSSFAGLMFVAIAGVLGIAILLVLYALKSALGIDIFKDTHLSDLLGH